MKRITAFLIILIITLSSLNAFALNAGNHTQTIRSGNIKKVSISSMTNYNSDDLKQCVVYFELPVPALSANQRIVDYRLNFYTKNNKLATGYTLGAFKLPEGETLILEGKGLSGSNNAKAVENFYKNYSTNGISDAYIYNVIGVNDGPKSVKLTSYLHEMEKGNSINGYIYVAISILQPGSIAIDASKPVTVEYTIVNVNEVSGYGVNEIKIASDACDHYNAEALESLTADASYKPVIKAYNHEDEAKNVNLYVATYNDMELESLTYFPITLNPNDSDIMILADSFIAPSAGKKTKVFVWDADGKTPLAICAEATTAVGE